MKTIYFAAPMLIYDDDWYNLALARICESFSNCNIIPPKHLFQSNEDWQHKWPDLLNSVDMIIFTSDELGFIGRGTYVEIMSGLNKGIPILYLTPNTQFLPWGDITIEEFNNGNDWRRFARVTIDCEQVTITNISELPDSPDSPDSPDLPELPFKPESEVDSAREN